MRACFEERDTSKGEGGTGKMDELTFLYGLWVGWNLDNEADEENDAEVEVEQTDEEEEDEA